MPLTPKGEEIKEAMQEQYGQKKGEQVFYASANKGTIKGVHDTITTPGQELNAAVAFQKSQEYANLAKQTDAGMCGMKAIDGGIKIATADKLPPFMRDK